ncbi:MAG TPA: phosphotransferase [Ottowia sp.]|uniref:aminoglycoside phosphotransferase family protein n=1 Tax=Ottowia sp. TaxID=1898956 RepID=UPI002BC0C2EB|nr:phosphotransferase [Ottowia sp.]HMN21684.1 phosphotransferase [Ottowia sp.]
MSEPLAHPAPIPWEDPRRAAAFEAWLAPLAGAHGLRRDSLRPASADASFRRYFRIDADAGASRIIMDAPPAQEDCAPFVQVAGLMQAAGLRVPRILDWERTHGFILMSDLGTHTMMDVIDRARPDANRALYLQAVDALLAWQQASHPGVLPPYDEALLRRELQLFPDWYVARHRQRALSDVQRDTLARSFDLIVARNLAAPMVYVHRDFMPRNLMVPPRSPAAQGALPPEGAPPALGRPGDGRVRDAAVLGVLDFQDAVHGPVSYDIASLMRDAFLSWDEEFVLDITVRYWERAKKLGLLDFEDWHADFGSFWRAVEWMGLQRHLKVAGIFARLTLRDGKPKYLADAPRFIAYIRHTAGRYRELAPLLRLLDEIEGTQAESGWAFGRV